jgi:hypothetical protein
MDVKESQVRYSSVSVPLRTIGTTTFFQFQQRSTGRGYSHIF